MSNHPLAKYLATPSEPFEDLESEKNHPAYDPETQLQFHWNDINHHMQILASGKSTGDPDTRSATTATPPSGYPGSDDDTDDSGT